MKPYYENDNAILYNGDSLELLKTIESDSINLIHIDPPYNIHIAEWDKWESVEKYVEFMGVIFQELDRILKDNGTMYFWHMDMKQIPHLLIYLEKETNFILNNQIVWDKGKWRALSWLNPSEDNDLRSWFTTTEYCYMFTKQDEQQEYKYYLDYMTKEKNKLNFSTKEINKLLGYKAIASHWFYSSEGKQNQPRFISELDYLKLQELDYFKKPYKLTLHATKS